MSARNEEAREIVCVKKDLKIYKRCFISILLMSASGLMLPGSGFAQAEPSWISPTRLSTEDGYATLRWSVEGGESIPLFRISEEYSGQQQFSFTDQAQIRIFRLDAGEYAFWVQACQLFADGFPQCGKKSQQLNLAVASTGNEPVSLAEASFDHSRNAEKKP